MSPTTNPISLMSIYVKPHSPNTCQNVWEINHVCTKTLQNRCVNLNNLLSSSSRSSRSFLSFFSFFSFLLFFSSRLLPLTQRHHQHILKTFIKHKHTNSNINNNARKQREPPQKNNPANNRTRKSKNNEHSQPHRINQQIKQVASYVIHLLAIHKTVYVLCMKQLQ